jgi:hypothetical protein
MKKRRKEEEMRYCNPTYKCDLMRFFGGRKIFFRKVDFVGKGG